MCKLNEMSTKKLSIKELLQSGDCDKEVEISGWVRTKRGNKQVNFIALNDGSTINNIQIVVDMNNISEELMKKVTTGAAIHVKGLLVKSEGSGQSHEIQAHELDVLGEADPEKYPIQPKKHSLEFLRDHAHLRFRTNMFGAIFRIRHAMAFAIHQYFDQHGFFYLHTPLITASDCEGAGEMFRVTTLDPKNPPLTEEGEVDFRQDFFGKATNLTVSGQLEGELGAMALGKIYTFGPTFRAENSNTTRHLSEFWMIEPEIAFADLADDMDLAEDMLKYVIRDVMDRCPDELAMLNKFVDKGLIERLTHVANSDFARVTYTDAVKILEDAVAAGHQFDYPVSWGIDLQTEHERFLTEEHFKCPTFVTDYPAEIKAFYMRLNDDGKTVAAADCLVPGIGEIIGGSQREERLEVLERRIAELGMDPEQYKYYLDLRRYGTCKHAGFGLGFERLVMYLTGVGNIRDVLPHPRTVGSCDF